MGDPRSGGLATAAIIASAFVKNPKQTESGQGNDGQGNGWLAE